MPIEPRLTLATAGTRRPRWRRIRNLSAAALVAVVIAGAGVAFAGSSTSTRYRTATVTSEATAQTLNGVGTFEPVSQATVAFPTAGTVASVDVKPGDTVAAGTQLASLDGASLDQAVRAAQATVAQATLTLQRARNGQSVTSGGASSGASAQPTSYTERPSAQADVTFLSATAPGADLGAAQQAVVDAQKGVDHDLIAADQAYATAQQICASITSADSTTTTSTASSDASTSSASSSSSSSSDDVTACSNALNAVLDAQHQVSTSQDALAGASSALDKLLAQRAADLASSGGATSGPNTSSNASAPSGSSSSRSSTSTTPSAADLAAYQKAVDAADAKLAVAQQALLQAAIVSPIDGSIVAVNMAPGDTVTAGSTTATIVIAGTGGYEAVTMVKVTDLPKLKVGQSATVQPDGSDTTVTGKVTTIGLVSTSSSTGTTYPVTIGLSGDTSGLRDGGTAAIAITIASASDGLVVPSSAVHSANGRYSVAVLEGDTSKDVTVQIGAIGPEWTQIKSGLEAGQTVVLADLRQPLPTSATSSSNGQQQNRFGGRGGFVIPAN